MTPLGRKLALATIAGAVLALGQPTRRVARHSAEVPTVLGVDLLTSEQPKRPEPKGKPASYYLGNGERERARRMRQTGRR